MSLETPVLFCIFNRPHLTSDVFAAIRRQRPKTLLVVADGPRLECPEDIDKVVAARRVIEGVDWNCDVRTNFSESNLGCKARMATGITWGFAQCERLIILEDDCLPSDSFFPYCESLLDRFADDHRIMMISGDNFQPVRRTPFSYYFSKFAHIWGWASWRRAWQAFDVDMSAWPEVKDGAWLKPICCCAEERAYWIDTLSRQYANAIDTWDYSWQFSCWMQRGLTVLPAVNLITNIGFGPDATHTKAIDRRVSQLVRFELGSLHHPPHVIRHAEADAHTWNHIFKPSSGESLSPFPAGWGRWWNRLTKSAA